MATKPIYFSLESDEKKELDEEACRLGIKPSELARRRYRSGLKKENNVSPILESILKLSTFQYAALEKIVKQKEEAFGPVAQRGSELYDEALSKLGKKDSSF